MKRKTHTRSGKKHTFAGVTRVCLEQREDMPEAHEYNINKNQLEVYA